MVSVLTLQSDDPSLNLAESSFLLTKFFLKINEKEAGDGLF